MQRIASLRKFPIRCRHDWATKQAALRVSTLIAPDHNISDGLRLQGKVAIVTGGASGIGEATCRLFAAQGAKVVIADIQDEAGSRIQNEIGASSAYRHCDVSVESDVACLVDYALAQHGALHIMFNNAGISNGGHVGGTLPYLNMEEYTRIMDVNVKGVVHGVKHAARVMHAGGSIICTASVASVFALGYNHVYTIAKHAVAGIVKTAALELGAAGVRVNALSPHVVATPMVLKVVEKLLESGANEDDVGRMVQRLSEMPLQREGGGITAHDVAQAALFLASDESRCVSGHNLLLDGAFTSGRHFSFS